VATGLIYRYPDSTKVRVTAKTDSIEICACAKMPQSRHRNVLFPVSYLAFQMQDKNRCFVLRLLDAVVRGDRIVDWHALPREKKVVHWQHTMAYDMWLAHFAATTLVPSELGIRLLLSLTDLRLTHSSNIKIATDRHR
jgi:hypothetical protein